LTEIFNLVLSAASCFHMGVFSRLLLHVKRLLVYWALHLFLIPGPGGFFLLAEACEMNLWRVLLQNFIRLPTLLPFAPLDSFCPGCSTELVFRLLYLITGSFFFFVSLLHFVKTVFSRLLSCHMVWIVGLEHFLWAPLYLWVYFCSSSQEHPPFELLRFSLYFIVAHFPYCKSVFSTLLFQS